MNDKKDKEYLKTNPKLKKRLKKIGFILVIIGGLFTFIGFIDFFVSFGYGNPNLFFFSFLGMPLLFAGGICLRYGYMGEVARYTNSEIVPVKKDTFNYLLRGTREELSNTIKSIKGEGEVCPNCGEVNDKDAKFCKNCGCKLVLTCVSCKTVNDRESKFCKNCGKELR